MDAKQLLLTALEAQRRGDLAAGEQICRRIVDERPDDADGWHLLGLLAHQQGRSGEAARHIAQAVNLQPENVNYLNNLGQVLRGCGRFVEAESCFRRTIKIDPARADVLANLSFLLSQSDRRHLAAEPARRATDLAPESAAAHAALGEALSDSDLPGSLAAFKQSLFLDPDQPDALNNVGAVLTQMGHYWDAEAAFKQAIALTPKFPAAWDNLGIVHMRQNRQDQAMAAFDHALALEPNYVAARVDRSTALLLRGDFLNGWREYEWRWKAAAALKDRRTLRKPLPLINQGWDLAGKHVLVYAEQGFGDIIHFIRYVPLLARRGATVTIAKVPGPLLELIKTVDGVAGTVRMDDGVGDPNPKSQIRNPKQISNLKSQISNLKSQISNPTSNIQNDSYISFDFDANLMSLPFLFQTALQTIPAEVPYLGPPAEKVRHWHSRLAPERRLKVGLRWAGNPKHSNDLNRSLDPNLLIPLLNNKRAAFYSLQVDRDKLTAPNLMDWTTEFHDFSDTAALIANLDLVISVDTAVAHLAGAMAKPTWVMLPYGPEFRWLLDRTDSPWYPTMRLFRQPTLGDWAGVVASVQQALDEL